jgi:predicted permease
LYNLSGTAPDQTEKIMGFYAFYVVAIVILILHFTGWLRRNNLEWLVLVLAAGTFPAVIFLK